MQSNYKRLGDYIQLVDERNSDLEVSNLVGLTINKEFIPSVANTIGSDMANYKIIRKNRFACSLMQVRRDKKIPMALFREEEPAIISQAYPVFEIIDTHVLLPEYLMMWFSRAEFDRQACFYAVGGVRGSLEWSDFCDFKLPIPDIDEQQALVNEYQTIERRIQLNEQLCQKLEETAQALYRKYFVEDIDTEDLPEGWSRKSFTEVIELNSGGTPNTNIPYYWNGTIPFFTPSDISTGYYSIETEKNITHEGLKNSSTKLFPKNTVFVTARGTVGAISIAGCDMAMNQSCYAITGDYVFYNHQLTIDVINFLKKEAVGAVFGALVTKNFEAQLVVDPPNLLKEEFNTLVSKVYDNILLLIKENQKLKELLSLLLAKMGRE